MYRKESHRKHILSFLIFRKRGGGQGKGKGKGEEEGRERKGGRGGEREGKEEGRVYRKESQRKHILSFLISHYRGGGKGGERGGKGKGRKKEGCIGKKVIENTFSPS